MKRLIEWICIIVVVVLAAGGLLLIGSILGAEATQARVNLTVNNMDTVLMDILADMQKGNVRVAEEKLGVLHTNRFDLTLPVKMTTLKERLKLIEKQE